MPDIIDLSVFKFDGDGRVPDRKVDLSGKPKPKHIRAELNSGVLVRCEVRYDGIDTTDDTRRFLVIAEIDWENYHPVRLWVGEIASDTTLIFRVPGLPDDQAQRFARGMQVVNEKVINVPKGSV